MMGFPAQFSTRLWIGSINVAMNTKFLHQQNITAVLTCGDLDLPWCDTISSLACKEHCDILHETNEKESLQIRHVRLQWEQFTKEHILKHLQKGLHFIETYLATEKGDILLHCLLGQNRSPTMALAYLLFKKKECHEWNDNTFQDTYTTFRTIYPGACIDSSILKLLQTLTEKDLKFITDTESVLAEKNTCPERDTSSDSRAKVTYHCRRCNYLLFNDTDVIYCHLTTKAKAQHFKNYSRHEHPKPSCTSIFTSFHLWNQQTKDAEGKLLCLNEKCRCKLGAFAWYGLRCSCGAWQAPAFQINKNKIDEF